MAIDKLEQVVGYTIELALSSIDGAWGSAPGDRAGPPLPVRPGALGEVLSS